MPPRRKQPGVPESNAITYWLDDIGRVVAQDAADNSFHDLILDAHRWGEAMVRAELACMEGAGVPADKRQVRFGSMGHVWYTRGYRYWLAPGSSDAPEAIRMRTCPNKRMAAQTIDSLRHEAMRAGSAWSAKHASEITCAVARAVDAQTHAKVQRQLPSPARRSPAARSPVVASPRTVIAPKPPPGPELPRQLQRLLTSPAVKVASSPRPCIREWVQNAFYDARIMRAWDASASGERELSSLAMEARTLELNLHTCNLEVIYGDGDEKAGTDALWANGLGKLASGGFNTIWGCRKAHPRMRAVLPAEVWEPFAAGALVLRIPKIVEADWLTLEQAVGEASNMLFCALCDCGPRVAALSFARKLFRDPDANEEGVRVVKYKIFAFLECARQGVDVRYAVDTRPPSSSAAHNAAYYNALLVAVYQYSHEGFVHLDATLRNFVDFYDAALPRAPTNWAVKVIDVEDKHFRRLCPKATTEWRDLFLFNLMVVLVFLKVSLGGRWDADIHWRHALRSACLHLRIEVEGKSTLPAIAMWEGVFDLYEGFPDMTLPPYAGDTCEATMYSAVRQLRYYLLEQPIEEATKWYVEVLKDPKADQAALRKAREWHDGHYRRNMVPAHRFFLHRLAPPGSARRFVDVAFEFLDTSHANLQLECFPKVPLSSAHNRWDSREYLLRVH